MKKYPGSFTIGFAAAAVMAVCWFQRDVQAQTLEPAAGIPNSKSLSTLQFEYQVFFAELSKPLKALGKRYAALLQKQEAELIAAGNQAGAKILRQEIEFFEVRKAEIPQALAEARRLQGIYDRERLPLARERARKARLLMEHYRQNLQALRPELVRIGNTEDIEKIDAELKGLLRTGKELTAAAAPGRRPQEPIPVFQDGFDQGRLRGLWTIRNGNPVIADGWLRTADNETEVEIPLGFQPEEGFRIEVDVEKQGENHHSGWDFEIVVGGVKGSLLFDAGTEDRLTLAGEEIVAQKNHAADSANRGKAVLTWLDGKARFQFTNSQGRSLRSEWMPIAIWGDPVVRLRLGGGGDESPRAIDNVRIYRGEAAGDGGS